jgi:hypothetical protein
VAYKPPPLLDVATFPEIVQRLNVVLEDGPYTSIAPEFEAVLLLKTQSVAVIVPLLSIATAPPKPKRPLLLPVTTQLVSVSASSVATIAPP